MTRSSPAESNFTGMMDSARTPAARTNQRLVIGPWVHLDWGRSDSEPAPLLKISQPSADSPINQRMLAWYDHFLKGVDDRVAGSPRVE